MSTKDNDLKKLTILGKNVKFSKKLECFPNQNTERFYLVTLSTSEFTCKCPVTGQPDFASIKIEYIPDERILESKSFKLYLWSYRDEGIFHEHLINTILDDIVKTLEPHWCKVTGNFNPRGGVGITVEAENLKTKEAREYIPSKRSC